jgi:hypothetical protein
MSDNYGIDHGHEYADREAPDTLGDPEGSARREERPLVSNRFANDMMVFNPTSRRWEPSQVFITQTAKAVRDLHKAMMERQKPLTDKDAKATMKFFELSQAAMESGPFSGLLYGLKDLIVKQLCSTYIWMKHSDHMRADMLNQGADPGGDNVQKSEAAIEKNRVAFGYYSNLLRLINDEFENQISLTDFAWLNGAKQASWDYLGYHKRQASNPKTSAGNREIPRSDMDLLMG